MDSNSKNVLEKDLTTNVNKLAGKADVKELMEGLKVVGTEAKLIHDEEIQQLDLRLKQERFSYEKSMKESSQKLEEQKVNDSKESDVKKLELEKEKFNYSKSIDKDKIQLEKDKLTFQKEDAKVKQQAENARLKQQEVKDNNLIDIENGKLNLEKEKLEAQKDKDKNLIKIEKSKVDLEKYKFDKQQELELERIKLENRKLDIEEKKISADKIKSENDAKRSILEIAGKIFGEIFKGALTFGAAISPALIYKDCFDDSVKLERQEMGILPKQASSAMNKIK